MIIHILRRYKQMPIVIAPVGKPLKVVRIAADEKTKKHLESLGIVQFERRLRGLQDKRRTDCARQGFVDQDIRGINGKKP